MAREFFLSLVLLVVVACQSFAATDGDDQEAATSISADEPAYIANLRIFAEAHPGVPYPPVTAELYGVPPNEWTKCPESWVDATEDSIRTSLIGNLMGWTVGHMFSLRVYRTPHKSVCAILDRPERRLLTGPEFVLYENVARLALRVTERNLSEEDTSERGAKAQQGVEPDAGGVVLPDVPPAPMLRIDVPPLGDGDEKVGDNPNGSCAPGEQLETGQNSGAEC